MNSEDNDNADELLDRVASHLRATPPPPVPSELLEGVADRSIRVKPKPPRRRIKTAAWGLSMAAALLVAAWFVFQGLRSRDVKPEIAEDQWPQPAPVATIITPLSDLEPYAELEQKLDSMTAEIATLRQQAELLDAYQKVNELLAFGVTPSP